MTRAICFLAILGCSLALPSSKVIEPLYVHVDPIKTVDLPGARIIGGHEVEPNSAPYMVAVLANGQGLCGGSLISTTRVLTAAHCTIFGSFIELRFGAHFFQQAEQTQVRVTSTNVINHEGYDDVTFQNDVSVVFLPTPVTLTSAIQVIPLTPSTSSSFAGTSAYLTGWGLTESFAISPFLRGVELSIISNSNCASLFNMIVDSMLCTSGVSSAGSVGGCSSDSGSPLIVDGVQVGIVNFGSGACTAGLPTGFARVSWFREWIRTNAGV